VPEQVQFSHLGIRDFDFRWIELGGQAAIDAQTGLGFGLPNQTNDG
jgi:hypothetical protein